MEMSAQQGDDYINYNCGDCLPYIALHMCTCALTWHHSFRLSWLLEAVQTLYITFELHELSIEITYELLIQICFNVWIRSGSADRSRSQIDKPSIRQFDMCAV